MTICKGCFAPVRLIDRMYRAADEPVGLALHESDYCPNCRVKCYLCGDWLKGMPEIAFPEGRVHDQCVTAIREELEADNG